MREEEGERNTVLPQLHQQNDVCTEEEDESDLLLSDCEGQSHRMLLSLETQLLDWYIHLLSLMLS